MQTEPQNGTGLHWAAGQTTEGPGPEQQRTAIAHAERSLREQRTELLRMMGELRQMQDALRNKQHPELEGLRAENAQLQELLAEREHEREVLTKKLEERQREVEALRQPSPQANPELEERLAKLPQENELLRQLLQEKDALVEELQKRAEPADKPKPGMDDLERYEAELHQFRRQIESDRAKLAQEIQALRTRNEELDEATREMEMELSRERAELARERTRLDRLREEVRAEMERFSRDGGVMDRLVPFQRLREQILERKPGAAE